MSAVNEGRTAMPALAHKPGASISSDGIILRIGVLLIIAFLLFAVAAPLWTLLSKSVQNADGGYVGLANFVRYVTTPSLVQAVFNTAGVALLTTAIVVPLAFTYAYAITRSRIPLKGLFVAAAMLPIFAPSLLSAISFIYLFGNQGMAKGLLFGASIYGPIGIVLAQIFYCFPHAVLILITALSLGDQRLYEAAEVLGTSKFRVFTTVTLPGAKYGLISAAFVVFTLVVTDFGIAKVIGGQFAVLATDAYKQVVGQQNFEMGAVVGTILLVPAILAFVVDRIVQRRQVALLSARAVPYQPGIDMKRDTIFFLYCATIATLLIIVLAVAAWASFVTYWPYNLALTLKNYDFAEFDAEGWRPYWNTLQMAALVAVIGTPIIFTGAYLIEKGKGFALGRAAAHLIAMLPMAVPGLVLGLGYVFFFNAPWNPANVLYATMAIMVINTIAHFYTVAHVTSITQLKQIDPEFESVSASLKVPIWRTYLRVTAPISLPAILDIAVYMFVNAMTTVSAVIFLYGSDTKLASIAIVHMDEAGQTAAAAGFACVLVATAIATKVLHLLVDRFVLRRFQAWRVR